MGQFIHAQKVEGKVVKFRIWSENSDTYVTKELSEAELRKWALEEAIRTAVENCLREIDELDHRIARALENGTSYRGDSRDLAGPWDKELN